MRNPERIDLFLQLLGEEWKRQGTDLRFIQFLFNNGIVNTDKLHHMEEIQVLTHAFPEIPKEKYKELLTFKK